jgi:hypothetical protein
MVNNRARESPRVFILFTSHAPRPIEISASGAVKGFSRSLERGKAILQEILLRENQEDQVPVNGVIVQYREGALTSAMWTLNRDQYVVAGYQCQHGECIENDQVLVDDFDARFHEEVRTTGCPIM